MGGEFRTLLHKLNNMKKQFNGYIDYNNIQIQKDLRIANKLKSLMYHPSNSKRGIAIKGTNVRIELI